MPDGKGMTLVSFVVPSKDRRDYAVSCLRSLLGCREPDIEVVVQDNSADDGLWRLLDWAHSDERLRYEHRSGPLSVIDNCNAGMRRARGEFVSLIGDDDTALPDCIAAARWASAQGLDALTPGRLAQYNWPDVRYRYFGARLAGELRIWPFSGRTQPRDVAEGVRAAAKEAFQGLVDSVTLPKLYYGLVRRSCFQRLQAEAGTCFPGVSPDMAAAVGVSRYVERMASIDYPLFLPGTSARSTAGANALKRHVGRLEDQPHLPRGCVETWPKEVPPVFTVQTVWAQSGLQALRATGRSELARASFDIARLHAMCGVMNEGHFGLCLRHYVDWCRANGGLGVVSVASYCHGVGFAWWRRWRFLSGRLCRRPRYVGVWAKRGIPDIQSAGLELQSYLRKSRWTIDRALRSMP